jgi:MerR family transcriptional regulator, thiopeptide resistance regulator
MNPWTLTLRHALDCWWKGEITLDNALYRTGQFAQRANVSIRTLRFYDKLGLLSPSARSESGYRLYSDEDLPVLQQIVALKYLGLSLEEIRECLNRRPGHLAQTLERQKRLMAEKRTHLEGVMRAIEEAEKRLESGSFEWNDLTRVIDAMQMEQNSEWVKSYFTDQQLETMAELRAESYSEEAEKVLAARPAWAEADQQRVSAQWKHVAEESARLAAAGADPAGEEGQAVAKLKTDLLAAFTQGSPQVEAGLQTFWEKHNALPLAEQPLASWSGIFSGPGAEFLSEAGRIYQERKSEGNTAS